MGGKLSCIVLALLAASGFVGCGKSEAPATNANGNSGGEVQPPSVTEPGTAPVALAPTRRASSVPQDIQMRIRTSAGEIVVRLFPDKAPRTVENFLDYARDGFYEGTVVHHAEPSLVMLGGCMADMELKPTRFPILNEANNGLTNRRGTIAMARLPESAHSATTQFFINLTDNPAFNYQGESDAGAGYCVFGEVLSGMDVAEQIGKSATGPKGDFSKVPQQAVVIEKIEDVGYVAANQPNVPVLK